MSSSPERAAWLRDLFIPLLLLVIYSVCFGLYSLHHETRSGILHAEEDTVRKVSVEMSQFQSTLDYFLREGNLVAVRESLASLGYDPRLQVGLLIDDQQLVQASTRLALLERPAAEAWPELELPENVQRRQQALEFTKGLVEVSGDRQRVVGFYPIPLSFGPAPKRTGFLFFQHDLKELKNASRYAAEQLVLRSTLMLLVIAGAMGFIVQRLLGRRIQHLVVAAQGMAEQIGRSREQLRENEERFQTLIERSPDAILVHRDGRLVFHNPAAAGLLGYERSEELRGRPLTELTVSENVLELMEPSEEGSPHEVHWVHPSGRQVLGEVVTFPLMFEGKPARVSIVRDITERKQLQEKLSAADRMASLGTLAAGVAHEINNPLAFILSNMRFVRDELQELSKGWGAEAREQLKELHEALDEALSGGDRVRDIVRDLRTFSRQDTGNRGPVNLHAVLDLCGNIAQGQLRHRAQWVKAYGEVPPVHASESRLTQLFLNLIINAAQAIPEGEDARRHEVRVTTRLQEEGWVLVEVQDTGSGIPPENLPRLFDPFFTTKPAGVGTGLGLSICHGIVLALGGRITVESEVGRGTTFRVFLPVVQAGPPVEGGNRNGAPPTAR
jgi:PAS domain S-box-containing protein